jgi:hypothetical protein
MAAALQEQLQQRRLSPIELIREALNFTRERWSALLVIGLITLALPRALSLLPGLKTINPRLGMGRAMTIGAARLLISSFADVMTSIGRMSTALIVFAWVHNTAIEPLMALRRPFATGWRWLALFLLLSIPELLYGGVLIGIDLGLINFWFPQSASYSQLRATPHDLQVTRLVLNRVMNTIYSFVSLYFSMAWFALILEDAGAIEAIKISVRRVHRNWLWLCAGSLLVKLPAWLFEFVLGRIPAGASHSMFSVGGFVVLDSVMRVVMALGYINLMLRAQAREQAMELAQ